MSGMTETITTAVNDACSITWATREPELSELRSGDARDIFVTTTYRQDWHIYLCIAVDARKPLRSADGRLLLVTSLYSRIDGESVTTNAVLRPCGGWGDGILARLGDGSDGPAVLDGAHAVNAWTDHEPPGAQEANARQALGKAVSSVMGKTPWVIPSHEKHRAQFVGQLRVAVARRLSVATDTVTVGLEPPLIRFLWNGVTCVWMSEQGYERQFNQRPIPLQTCRFCSISLSMDGPPTSHPSEWTAPSAVDPLAKDDRFYTCQADACQQAGMALCDSRRDLAYEARRKADWSRSTSRSAELAASGGGGGNGARVVVLTGDVSGGGVAPEWNLVAKPLRTASVSLVPKDTLPPGGEQRVWHMEPLRPDGFRQSAVDAAKAVLLSTTPKKVKP